MADAPDPADPFAPRAGTVASLAGRLGCSEGQLYSMVIGVLLLWVISANGLPGVVWDPAEGTAPSPRRSTPVSSEVAAPAAPAAPSAGLISGAPAPAFSPVTTPLTDVAPSPSPLPSPSPVSDTGADTPSDLGEDAGKPGPLRVVDGGYASAAAGSPLATVGVPDGSVAVARRAGQPFHITFLRLEGQGPTLELFVDGRGTNTFDALAGLSLCVVPADGWQVDGGSTSLEEAPDYDCSEAVDGRRSDTGDRWSFDTSALVTSAIGGIAIVPSTAPGTPEFQIVFSLD